MATSLLINGQPFESRSHPETPLLWVLRDELGLTGTKFGCGVAACGSCTVQVDGEAQRSCQLSVGAVTGAITTIEGAAKDPVLPAVQQAWIDHQVAQCGYCQAGQALHRQLQVFRSQVRQMKRRGAGGGGEAEGCQAVG